MFCGRFTEGWLVKSESRAWKAITGRKLALHISVSTSIYKL
jgi:hypothetical protein